MSEWIASASIAELPEIAAAANFETAIARLPRNPATTALLDSSAMDWMGRLEALKGFQGRHFARVTPIRVELRYLVSHVCLTYSTLGPALTCGKSDTHANGHAS